MELLTLSKVEFDYEEELTAIQSKLNSILGVRVKLNKIREIDLEAFYSYDRGQFNAAKIIEAISGECENYHVLLTSVDLFIPIFTYVFGLAKLNGKCAVVSTHRLDNEFYGLPENINQLRDRIVKEVVHELGHLLGLQHCPNYYCVMASSTSVDELDLKGNNYCPDCKTQIVLKNS
ncbi:MAG: archaemetzincin family Zn-dependent metalloprotease [Melioribacteraceae bacterium]|nr:archaemetzincin family Zn-dependent metalloprotease [Melioribacteraceae bacterium]MDD3558124.1 archaemetzincin family Zn-dependent metalloprotease [Melioribacteraceae bacterium]